MTHTPGTWNQHGSIIWSPDRGIVCELYEPKSSEDSTIYPYDASDEARANARLITTAPELLAACRAISKGMGELAAQGYFCPFCSRRYAHGPDCPFLKVSAALAKVRGGSDGEEKSDKARHIECVTGV